MLLNLCDCYTTVTATLLRGEVDVALMPLDRDAQMLCDFGLTINQAKVYLAIVHLGIAPVGKVSKLSKVRREDIYRILPRLEETGLVEKILGTPTKIRAIPLDDALTVLIRREKDSAEKKVSELTAKKDDLLKHLKSNNRRIRLEEKETQFALLSARDAVISKTVTILKKAEKEIDLITSAEEFYHLLPLFAEQLEKALKRHLKVRLILEVSGHEESPKSIERYLSAGAYLDVRYAYHHLSHYLIADHRQVLMATSPEPPIGEHPYLWTDNKNFAGLMQENFEQVWHSGVNSKVMETDSVSEKATRFVEKLETSDHVIFVYQSTEAKHDILFNYIKVGLEKGDAGIYVASDENPSEIRNAMKEFGISVEKYEKAGALRILDWQEVYIIDGKFEIPATMSIWNKHYNEAVAKGFKGLRVTGEMACFFKHQLLPELVEYEMALHRILDLPIIAICAYNADDLTKAFNPINLYNELVKAHGTVLFAGMDNKMGKIEIRKA
jgi:sugar-specific transcriptional regulator TrmB